MFAPSSALFSVNCKYNVTGTAGWQLGEEGGQRGRHTEHLSSFKDILYGDHDGHTGPLVSDLDF